MVKRQRKRSKFAANVIGLNVLPWFFLVAIVLIFLRVYVPVGIPDTHDGQIHLARFGNFKRAFREGQIPPRWGPNLMNGYGYPVFNFNYPLANIIALPFSFLPISYELIFKLIVVGSLLMTLYQLNRFLKLLKIDSPMIRAVALSSFVLNPYMINLIYFRGGIGEMLAISLISWLLVIFEKIRRGQFELNDESKQLELGMLVALFVLSHNVLAYFGILVLGFYLIGSQFPWRAYLKMIKPALISFGFSAWFWLPAILEKKYTVLDESPISNMFQDQFPTLSQILFAPIQFGYSHQSPVDSLSLSIGIITITVLFLGISDWLINFISKTKHKKSKNTYLVILIILILLLTFFQLPISIPIWKFVPMGKFIQFPWRLSAFIAIFVVPLIGFLMTKFGKIGRGLIILVTIWQVIVLFRIKQPGVVSHSTTYHETFPESTSTMHENKARTFVMEIFDEWEPRPTILGNGTAQVIKWNGTRRQYQLQLHEESLIIEQTMNFPGWQTIVNDIEVEYLDDSFIQGRVAYRLPAGSYMVQTRFTQDTPSRKIGNGLFIVTLFYAIYQRVKIWYAKNFSTS